MQLILRLQYDSGLRLVCWSAAGASPVLQDGLQRGPLASAEMHAAFEHAQKALENGYVEDHAERRHCPGVPCRTFCVWPLLSACKRACFSLASTNATHMPCPLQTMHSMHIIIPQHGTCAAGMVVPVNQRLC